LQYLRKQFVHIRRLYRDIIRNQPPADNPLNRRLSTFKPSLQAQLIPHTPIVRRRYYKLQEWEKKKRKQEKDRQERRTKWGEIFNYVKIRRKGRKGKKDCEDKIVVLFRVCRESAVLFNAVISEVI